jgi:hypothetical protein
LIYAAQLAEITKRILKAVLLQALHTKQEGVALTRRSLTRDPDPSTVSISCMSATDLEAMAVLVKI